MPQDKQNSKKMPPETPENGATQSALDSGISNLMRAKDFLVDAWYKMNNLEQTNFALAVRFMNQGSYNDAVLRLKIVLWLNPKNPYAHYLLGKAYVYAKKRNKAIEPLKIALKAKPDLEEAMFFLAVCGIGGVPDRVPPSLVIEQLEALAGIYDEQIANNVNLPVYQLGTKVLLAHLEGKQGFNTLDLDMRTGKSGEYALSFANNIVGVEPCMQMISQARPRRVEDKLVYNELVTKTSTDYLHKEERKFEIVQSYFSSNAYGGLQEFFELIAAHLRPKGLFLLAVEGVEGEGFTFNISKMSFQHSAKYIEKTAKKNDFEIVNQEKLDYKNGAFDLVFLLKKKD